MGTTSHNTVMINNKDQMEKGSRFIWLDWTKSKLLKFDIQERYTIFEGSIMGIALNSP
ncbi:hypothetical protein CV093_17890 [Oceanobacillus sp. 143]|nr:hypothetical protein CV093_17890 [Oceanobacillus sp. 143]